MPAPGALFGAKRTCHLSFGQASELSVPLDREWLEQIIDSRVAAFAQPAQSVPAEVS